MTSSTVSQNITLRGNEGELIQQSPCGTYQIRRAYMLSFRASCVVNPTDPEMRFNTSMESNGRCKLIACAAGAQLRPYIRNLRPDGLAVGDAVASPSFNIKTCHWLVHVNAPTFYAQNAWEQPKLRLLLADCHRRCLEEAFKVRADSVAFPAIGTGVCGWPLREAVRIALSVVTSWMKHPIHGAKRRSVIQRVYFIVDPLALLHQEKDWISGFSEIWPENNKPELPVQVASELGPVPDVILEPGLEATAEAPKTPQSYLEEGPVTLAVVRTRNSSQISKRELTGIGVTAEPDSVQEVQTERRSSSRIKKKPRWYGKPE